MHTSRALLSDPTSMRLYRTQESNQNPNEIETPKTNKRPQLMLDNSSDGLNKRPSPRSPVLFLTDRSNIEALIKADREALALNIFIESMN